jgi:serine/threonine protein kinase
MEQARWERLQEIYHQAVALPLSERDAFAVSACADDLDLLHEVRGLLKAAETRGGILHSPVVELGSTSDNLLGTTIGGRYLIESALPHGGMSQVYLASDLRLQSQRVVLKILASTLIENAYAQQKFDQEVEALLRMDYSGVVRVQDRGELEDGRPYIVMPYIDGVPLSSEIPKQGIDLQRASSIIRQIGAALDHVHAQGIFHRDLKPENIMLRRGTDSVVLIDFGIAKVSASLIAASTVNQTAGTLPYMSPEQLRGEQITASSDVYAMGVVAYEMVTGRIPFNPASASQLLEMQRAGPRVRPKQLRENISVTADRAILRALTFKPDARYKKAGEFGEELGNDLLAGPGPTPNRVPKFVKVIAVLIVLAAVSYGVYKGLRQSVKPPPSPSFSYFLTVKNVGNGQEYKSNGEDIFESGDKFQLNISASEPGYLYVFNERALNDAGFTMIFPRKEVNNGSATVGANQIFQTDWNTFSGPPGDENIWIVWSVSTVPQLESAKTEAFSNSHGALGGDNLVAVRSFLTEPLEFKTTVYHYKEKQIATARSKGDLLLTLAQFKHR